MGIVYPISLDLSSQTDSGDSVSVDQLGGSLRLGGSGQVDGGEGVGFSSAAGGENAGILCYVVGKEFGGFIVGQDFGTGFGQSAVLKDGEGELVGALVVIGWRGFCEDGF